MRELYTPVVWTAVFSIFILGFYCFTNKRINDKEKHLYIVAYSLLALTAAVNWGSYMINGADVKFRMLHAFLKAIEHSMAPLLFVVCARFVSQDKVGLILIRIFHINVILQLLSMITGWAYYIDEANIYHRGPAYYVLYVFSFVGFAYEVWVYYSFSTKYKKSNVLVLVLIAVLLWAGVLLHLINPDIRMEYICTIMAMILVYIYVDDFSKQKTDDEFNEQLSVMDALTVNYECVYKVDLDTHLFEALRISDFISEQLGRRLTPETAYEVGMEAYASLNVYSHDREMFRENSSIDVIVPALAEKKEYAFEYRIVRNNSIRFFRMSAALSVDVNGKTNMIIGFSDIDDQKTRLENLVKMSNTDQMTELYNRRAYNEELESIDALPVEEKADVTALMMDLNGLKEANDKCGHEAGDELIIGFSKLLVKTFGKVGKCFRMGGDEFVVIARIPVNEIERYVERLREEMTQWRGQYISNMTSSIGYVGYSECEGNVSMEELVKCADKRMYKDKQLYYSTHDRRR